MAKDIDMKEIGLAGLMGVSVFVGTPLVMGFLPAADWLAISIIPNMMSIGEGLVAAGIAFGADLGITKWLR